MAANEKKKPELQYVLINALIFEIESILFEILLKSLSFTIFQHGLWNINITKHLIDQPNSQCEDYKWPISTANSI